MIFKERLARTYGAGRENFGHRPKGAFCNTMFLFLGPTDMAAIFVVALLLFGPEQLPKVARQLGDAMRHMQNTTQSFMLEMDRAARETEVRPHIEPETALELPATEERSSEEPAGDSPASEGPPHVET